MQLTMWKGRVVIREQIESVPKGDALNEALLAERAWRTVAVIVNDQPDEASYALALSLAARDGTQVILYDASASSGWTSPYPPGEKIRPVLLDEAGVRRSGRDHLADGMRSMKRAGHPVSAYLSAGRSANDVARLVAQENVDLVICQLPLKGRLVRNVHLTRRHGASLLECAPGHTPALYPPLDPDESVPVEERVQMRFLAVILLTFLAARLRNRPES